MQVTLISSNRLSNTQVNTVYSLDGKVIEITWEYQKAKEHRREVFCYEAVSFKSKEQDFDLENKVKISFDEESELYSAITKVFNRWHALEVEVDYSQFKLSDIETMSETNPVGHDENGDIIYEDTDSANIEITGNSGCYLVQMGLDHDFSIPTPDEACFDEYEQAWFRSHIDLEKLFAHLGKAGFEPTWEFLCNFKK